MKTNCFTVLLYEWTGAGWWSKDVAIVTIYILYFHTFILLYYRHRSTTAVCVWTFASSVLDIFGGIVCFS